MSTLAFIGGLSAWEMGIILVLALLLFGKRLPEVGKSLGKGIIEFKKGLKGVEDDVEQNSSSRNTDTNRISNERAYRAPLTDEGADRRVSRAEEAETPVDARPASGNH